MEEKLRGVVRRRGQERASAWIWLSGCWTVSEKFEGREREEKDCVFEWYGVPERERERRERAMVWRGRGVRGKQVRA